MNRTISRFVWAVLLCLMIQPVAAQAEKVGVASDFERGIEEARRQLDDAAQRIKALYTEKYGPGKSDNRAMLGILLGDRGAADGVEIVGVTPGGGAEAAGMQAGDVIVQIGDLYLADAVSPMRGLTSYMKGVSAGDDVRVEFVRDGEHQNVSITTLSKGAHVSKMIDNMDFDFGFSGLGDVPIVIKEVVHQQAPVSDKLMAVDGDLARYFDVDAGVIVLEPAAGSMLKAGDVLVTVGDLEITDLQGAHAALGGIDGQAEVFVKRRGKGREVRVAEGEFAAVEVHEKRVIRIRKRDDSGAEETIVETGD